MNAIHSVAGVVVAQQPVDHGHQMVAGAIRPAAPPAPPPPPSRPSPGTRTTSTPGSTSAWRRSQNDFAGARESLQHAAALDPARADVQNNLGTVLVARGDLAARRGGVPPGADAQARLRRGAGEPRPGADRRLAAKATRPPPASKPASYTAARRRQPKILGVRFSDADFTYLGIQGAVVDSVNGESPAERAGLRKGDVVLGVDGNPVEGPQQLLRYLRDLTGERDYVEMDILRDGQPRRLRVDMF